MLEFQTLDNGHWDVLGFQKLIIIGQLQLFPIIIVHDQIYTIISDYHYSKVIVYIQLFTIIIGNDCKNMIITDYL